jgi:hypothetical protein
MVWNRDSDRRGRGALLHDDMTTAAPHLAEAVDRKDDADFLAGEDAEPTQR